ncbi:polysaccharide deacetylase family protein [Psychrobacillus sp.]|uniref:polysaccharide deacetylase family protein n=1 Tax=Psychrobacillus sp. TaxID=1871623 RepID=UPI0028BDB188|nr:polysaccharide deacetylase family protein [Psychrobacillus sp.]
MKNKHLFLFILLFVGLVFILSTTYTVLAEKDRRYYENTGEVVWEIDTKEKVVALTFDDGPHPKHTGEILDLLAKYNAKATFFVVGENIEKAPDILLRQYNEGHDIANHTYTHPIKTTIPKLEAELKKTNDLIYSITGHYPELFRPVEGQYTDEMIESVVKQGYKVVMWSWHLDTEDWKDPGVHRIVKTVLKGTEPGNVILFHDGGSNRSQTVKALEKILPELQKQGYKFVTITELLYMNNENEK